MYMYLAKVTAHAALKAATDQRTSDTCVATLTHLLHSFIEFLYLYGEARRIVEKDCVTRTNPLQAFTLHNPVVETFQLCR